MSEPLKIHAEATPNPNSTRYALNRRIILHTGYDFPNAASGEASPLAKFLFEIPGVRGVYIGPEFVTVTTEEEALEGDRQKVIHAIGQFIASGKPAVEGSAVNPHSTEGNNPLEVEIIRILDTEIRPAVAMDGGDITFVSVENGVVKLQLRGACHSCPSSIVTLKMGIETRLKQSLPEIESVEAV